MQGGQGRGTGVLTSMSPVPWHSYANVYRELEQTIRGSDAQEDLRWFRSSNGPGMPMNWPQFEVRILAASSAGGCYRWEEAGIASWVWGGVLRGIVGGSWPPRSSGVRCFVAPGVEPRPDAHDNEEREAQKA